MTESVEYSVLKADGRFEVREYPAMVLVTVEGLSDNESFRILLDYISGNNGTRRRVPMTAPVISASPGGERIPMTTPVVSRQGLFAFVLPGDFTADNSPAPLDPRASLVHVPNRKLAVLRFRGRAPDRAVRDRTEDLLSKAKDSGLETVGEPFLMRYNPPFIPGFLRRNEVAVEIAP
jgi:hypothetical protein